jgi:hypothetical protein
MKSTFVILMVILAGLCPSLYCAELTAAEEIDFLSIGRGIASPSDYQAGNIDTTTTDEFMPYASAFQDEDKLTTFQIPAKTPSAVYHYAGIGPVTVKPLERYRLRVSAIKYRNAETDGVLLFSVTYLKNTKPVLFNNCSSFQPQLSLMPVMEDEICIPPGTDSLILWVGWVNRPAQALTCTPKVIFNELRLVPCGQLDGNISITSLLNQNLLAIGNFEDFPLGPLEHPEKSRIFNIKQAEIVQAESRCLHITKGPTDNPFPYFTTLPVSLMHSGVEFTCKVKGKGVVHPMLWWWLKGKSWCHNSDQQVVELTDQWQTMRIWLPCLNPTQVFAAGYRRKQIYILMI